MRQIAIRKLLPLHQTSDLESREHQGLMWETQTRFVSFILGTLPFLPVGTTHTLPRTTTRKLKGYNSQNAVVYYFRLTFSEENLCCLYMLIWLQQQYHFIIPKAKTHIVFVSDSYIACFEAAICVHPDIPSDLKLCSCKTSFVARRGAKVETISQMLPAICRLHRDVLFLQVIAYPTKHKMASKLQTR